MHQQKLSSLTAVVLAGGLGTRLRSVVADRPKVLAEICGRPFITYLFDQLLDARIKRAVLCTGYLGDRIQETVGNVYKSLTVGYSRELSPLGTAGALRNALPEIDDDQVLVMNGDSYCDADLSAFWKWHESIKPEGSLLLTKVKDTSRYGIVKTGPDGKVARFSEKGSNRGPGFINAGIYLLRKQVIFSIPSGKSVSLEHEMFPQWIARGLYGYPGEARFIDIGTPEDYVKAESFFKGAREW